MTDLLDEARQDLREEKVQRLFFHYGKLFIIIAALFVIGSVINLWWKEHQFNKNAELGAKYMMAIMQFQAQKQSEGEAILEELAMKGEGAYSAIATLNLASSFAAKDAPEKAVHYYQMIVDNKNYDKIYKDFAAQMLISAKLNSGQLDNNSAIEEFEKYIASKPIFKLSGQEYLAALYIAESKMDKAKELLNSIITNSSATNNQRQSAEQFMILTN